jgi:hypothetical protein
MPIAQGKEHKRNKAKENILPEWINGSEHLQFKIECGLIKKAQREKAKM